MSMEVSMNVPSKPVTAVVVFFAACLALFSVSLFMTDLFRLKTVIYTPNVYMTEEILIEHMGLEKGKNLVFLMSEHRMEQLLLMHPFIEKAEVSKIFPSGLELNLTYRSPFLSIYNSGFYVLLDDSLRVLGVDELQPQAYGVSGFRYKEFKIGEKIKVENQSTLEHTVDLVLLMKKSHLTFTNVIEYKGGSVLIQTEDGIKGNFGEVENVERKFNNFVVIYENLKENGTTTGLIDVSTEGLPTYKPFDQ